MDTDVAAELRALSDRVRRNVPHRRDPERFHTEKSCIVQDLEALAGVFEDRAIKPEKLEVNRTRRPVLTNRVHRAPRSSCGRTARARAIFHGGR